MSGPEKIYKYYEKYNEQLNKEIFYLLLNDFFASINDKSTFNKNKDILDIFCDVIDDYIFSPNPKYKILLYNLLNQYGLNMNSLILSSMVELGFLDDPNKNKELIHKLVAFPIIQDISFDGKKRFTLYSQQLGTFKFELASIVFKKNSRFMYYINHNTLEQQCHENTFFLVSLMPELRAITSLCKSYFEGYYYHSYALSTDNKVIDLNMNAVMDRNLFDQLVIPKEISNVKGCDLRDNLYLASEYFDSWSDYHWRLLRIALYNQYLSIKGTKEMKKINTILKNNKRGNL